MNDVIMGIMGFFIMMFFFVASIKMLHAGSDRRSQGARGSQRRRVPEYEEPEEEEEEDFLQYEEEDPEERRSDRIPVFIPFIITLRHYVRMREDLEAAREELAGQVKQLAMSEGNYYLQDSKEWGRQYAALERRCHEAEADCYGKQRKIEYLESMIATYQEAMRTDEDTKNRLLHTMRGADGRYTEAPAQKPAGGLNVYKPAGPAAGREDPEAVPDLQKVPAGTSKAVRAYRMKARGASDSAIAQKLGISSASVRIYVNNGKKELNETSVHVTADGVNFHKVPLMEIDESGSWLEDPDYSVYSPGHYAAY